MSGLMRVQPKNVAKEKINSPDTTVLLIQDASVALKYTTSATLPIKTINPYGIMLGWLALSPRQLFNVTVSTVLVEFKSISSAINWRFKLKYRRLNNFTVEKLQP
jgi:hypothetical protein